MKRNAIIIALISFMAFIGCETQADRDKLEQDKMRLATTINNNFRELNDKKHDSYVRGAELQYGEQAGRTLEQCYEDGYDTRQNDDHTFGNDAKLGLKYVTKCDKIRKALDAYYDKADKAHQKEISQ